ncbi:hypothetical protein B0H15DRAFT_802412 [Mycena belliarum]|uniref:Uncharacterized protein n=1 Tax=Mycena belliarum TaxID=1033014 RepID=A0AAD6XKE9_9AGAR|nr:hypothetical protein B0H15DRAFT_802412 [Mycena belliae]
MPFGPPGAPPGNVPGKSDKHWTTCPMQLDIETAESGGEYPERIDLTRNLYNSDIRGFMKLRQVHQGTTAEVVHSVFVAETQNRDDRFQICVSGMRLEKSKKMSSMEDYIWPGWHRECHSRGIKDGSEERSNISRLDSLDGLCIRRLGDREHVLEDAGARSQQGAGHAEEALFGLEDEATVGEPQFLDAGGGIVDVHVGSRVVSAQDVQTPPACQPDQALRQ